MLYGEHFIIDGKEINFSGNLWLLGRDKTSYYIITKCYLPHNGGTNGFFERVKFVLLFHPEGQEMV